MLVLQLAQLGLQGSAALEDASLLLQATSERVAQQLLQLLLHAQMIILQLAELHEDVVIGGTNIVLADFHGC